MKKYIIRYNVEHKAGLSDIKWKIYSDDNTESYVVNSIKLETESWTEDTEVGEAIKYSIVTVGRLIWDDELSIRIVR